MLQEILNTGRGGGRKVNLEDDLVAKTTMSKDNRHLTFAGTLDFWRGLGVAVDQDGRLDGNWYVKFAAEITRRSISNMRMTITRDPTGAWKLKVKHLEGRIDFDVPYKKMPALGNYVVANWVGIDYRVRSNGSVELTI